MSLKFGLATIMAGLLGVPAGSFFGQKLRGYDQAADPLVCAVGMLLSAPLLYCGLMIATGPATWTYLCVFAGMWFLNLNWALVGDMLLVN